MSAIKAVLATFTLFAVGLTLAIAGTPSAPTDVYAVAGKGKSTVFWSAPADNGGFPIKSYIARSSTGKACTATGKKTKCVINGLPNFTPITFTVTARNAGGFSEPSIPSDPVVPNQLFADAVCGPKADVFTVTPPVMPSLCTPGVATDPVSTGNNSYRWTCLGLAGGANASCATPGAQTYKVGDRGPAGGTVIAVSGDKFHGIEAAPISILTSDWGCAGTFLGVTNIAVGTGSSNTSTIVSKCTTAGIAAQMARTYSLSGYNDWYLPSADEMGLVVQLSTLAAQLNNNGIYFTSSETGASTVAVYQRNLTYCSSGVGLCYAPWSRDTTVLKKNWATEYPYQREIIPVRSF